jgi:hypothetical protein
MSETKEISLEDAARRIAKELELNPKFRRAYQAEISHAFFNACDDNMGVVESERGIFQNAADEAAEALIDRFIEIREGR